MLLIEYPKCTICSRAKRWPDDHGADYQTRHIKEENPTYEEMKEWYSRSGLPIKRMFNTSGLIYRSMRFSQLLEDMPEDGKLRLLASEGMLIKCLISLRYTTETRQGRIRRAQTKGESILRMAFGYWRLLPMVIRDEGTLRVLAVMVVLNITVMLNQNFYSLYATAGLGIPEIFSPPGRPVVLVFYTLFDQHHEKGSRPAT